MVIGQVSGGQKFLPPRHDVNAPDLYIPFVALCTYCLLVSFIRVSNSTFKPENLYNTVRPLRTSFPCCSCILNDCMDLSRWMPRALSERVLFQAWYAGFTWGLQVLLLKTVLYMLGIASLVPWLELVAYSGAQLFPAPAFCCAASQEEMPDLSARLHVFPAKPHCHGRDDGWIHGVLRVLGIRISLHCRLPRPNHEKDHLP